MFLFLCLTYFIQFDSYFDALFPLKVFDLRLNFKVEFGSLWYGVTVDFFNIFNYRSCCFNLIGCCFWRETTWMSNGSKWKTQVLLKVKFRMFKWSIVWSFCCGHHKLYLSDNYVEVVNSLVISWQYKPKLENLKFNW